jgi:hypothetical protein
VDRPHRRTALTLIVIASVIGFLAIFAVWANRQLLNTDNWADTSSELLEDDAIRGQVSSFLTDQLYANVDVEQRLRAVLPPQAAPLAGPAAGGLKQLAEKGADALLQRPVPQRLWEEANRRAHRQLLAVLEGGGDSVSTSNGEVTLDLKSLLGQTESRVGVGGRAAKALPEGAGQIKILKSGQLSAAQDAVHVLKAIAWVLVLLMLGLFALAVYLARGWRREALRAVGFGFLTMGVGALIARELAGGQVVDALATTAAVKPAVQSTWSISTSLLVQAAVACVAYGVVIVGAAWLAGPTGVAVKVRGRLAPWLEQPRIAYGAVALIMLLLVAWGPTPAFRRPLAVVLLAGLLFLGMKALRRQTALEHPAATA